MRHILILLFFASFILACGGGKKTETKTESESTSQESTENPKYDPNRGLGKWSEENLTLGASLDAAMADEGEKIFAVKCASCHKLTSERLVGPGWAGVTNRRKPWWIMNFITNPDPMIEKDPAVQAQLELCLVRMPNQNLSDEEARNLLEFMRRNDGVK